MFVIDVHKKSKDYQSETEKNLKQLYLNEDLLTAMFVGCDQCAFIKNKVDVFRKCSEIDSILYYIFRGNVQSVDISDRTMVYNKYKEQEFFEINEEVNYIKKFIISSSLSDS